VIGPTLIIWCTIGVSRQFQFSWSGSAMPMSKAFAGTASISAAAEIEARSAGNNAHHKQYRKPGSMAISSRCAN
jgi:hypothetical protein